MKDKKASDGQLAECERIIRPGGRIKYARIWWQHEILKEFEGYTVLVCSDYWRTELDIFNLPTRKLNARYLTIKNPEIRPNFKG